MTTMEDLSIKLLDVKEVELSLRHFGVYDYVVFIVMLAICSVIGIYWGFIKKQSTQEYLVGGRSLKVFPVSSSLIASYVSGISLLGIPTENYIYGIQYMYLYIGMFFTSVVFAYCFLPVFYELKLTSIYEYLKLRFDNRVRLFGTILFALSLITWLPIVIYMPALAFNQVSGINIHIITPIVCVICIFYTCVGGLQAVIWTDVIQGINMFGAILFVAFKGTFDIGGSANVWNRNWESGRIEPPVWDPNPLVRHTMWNLLFGGGIVWLVNGGINQNMMQRYLSLPSLGSARRAVLFLMLGVLAIGLVCCYCGLLIYATYYDCDPLTTKLAKAKDQLFPLLVMDVMGKYPGLSGLFVAGVFSAALSSLSTGLNSMAAVILEDFCKPYTKNPISERKASYIMKFVVIVFGFINVFLVYLVEKGGQVLQLAASLGSVGNGAILGIFISGVLFPKINSNGVLAGGLTSLLVMSWICGNAQVAIANGHLKFPNKPVTTEGCTYTFESTDALFNNATSELPNDEIFPLYRISYMWYTTLGTIICLLVATIVSLIWKPIDTTQTDSRLYSPLIRKYYEDNNNKKAEIQMVQTKF